MSLSTVEREICSEEEHSSLYLQLCHTEAKMAPMREAQEEPALLVSLVSTP